SRWRGPGVAGKELDEDVHALKAMFFCRLKVTAHGAERLGASKCPKAPADLLLQLGHAQVSFSLVVVEGHGGFGPVPGDLVALVTQASEQVGSIAVGTAGSVTGGKSRHTPVYEPCITVTVGAQLAAAEAGPALGHGALQRVLCLHQQVGHIVGPGAVAGRGTERGQVPEQVSTTQSVIDALYGPVGFP